MKKVVFLTGAGLSSESGIATFRDSADGLWNNYKIEEVCHYNAWNKNPVLVQDFYNMRRREVLKALPNDAHIAIANFQHSKPQKFIVSNVTQNVDDLLERAGATDVIHVHGELLKARSSSDDYTNNPVLYDVGEKGLNYYSDYADDGFPLRPHVVFFGESLINYNDALDEIETADYLVIVGTSLNVYPVASFPSLVPSTCKIYYVDPTDEIVDSKFIHIKEKATKGVLTAIDMIEKENA